MEWIEVVFDRLVYGGDALGRLPDGRAVFAPFGLPGERVRLKVVEEKRSHCRAEILEVLEPSPRRITARCPHFGVCGGCHYQHLDYTDQLAIKTEIVRDQFQRLAEMSNPPVLPAVPSPSPWNYRNTVQFTLDGLGRVGYQRAGSNAHVPIRECYLPESEINDLWQRLDVGEETGIERLEIRQGMDGDLLMVMEGQQSPDLMLDLPVSIVFRGEQGEFVLAGDDHLCMTVLDKVFKVSAGSFFQVNTPQAGAMVRFLEKILPEHCHTLVDLYCGVGLFSAFFADRAERIIGVEQSPLACQDFAENLDQFEHIELYEGAAEVVLPALQIAPDVVLVDPPRAGIAREALDALLRLHPPLLAYISCDPATLARDAKRLVRGGYDLKLIQPFDLFPQTFHIENICLFEYHPGGES